MKSRQYLFVVILVCAACTGNSQTRYIEHPNPEDEKGTVILTRFTLREEGYKRIQVDTHSFAYYLRNLQLKGYGEKVRLYNGELKNRQDVHAAVIDMDVGNRNLQQCADAVMRLRAEYLYKEGRFNDIHFNFTNGFRAEYSRWRKGDRIKISGNTTYWVNNATIDTSYNAFRKYLDIVFAYAGTLSLSGELKKVPYADMQIGDVFIKGGSPGHAVIVVDMVENEKGEQMYMLAQSYMPAQEIHILKNENSEYSPWYKLDVREQRIETPEWTFTKDQLKRF